MRSSEADDAWNHPADRPRPDPTEVALRALVAEARRAEGAQRRRRAHWEAQASIASASIASTLVAARAAGGPAVVHLAGAATVHAARVGAIGPEAAAIALADGRPALLALAAVEAIEAVETVGHDPRPPAELVGLAAVLDALSPLRATLLLRSGARVTGRLRGAGDEVVVLDADAGGRSTVAVGSIAMVRLGCRR